MPIEKSEPRLKEVLLHPPNIFAILTGPDMIVSFANKPLLQSWNSDESIIGLPLLKALPDIADQPFPLLLRKVYASGEPHYGKEEKTVILKNGAPREVYYSYVYHPILEAGGAVSGITIMAANITEQVVSRKKAEEAQRDSEKQRRLYEAIISSTPDLMYVFDLNYRFIYANQALLNMWGSTWEQSIGKGLLENGYEPWHAAMHEREIDRVVATGRAIRGEVSFPHASLGKRVYDYIFVPVFNGQGEVEAVAGTTRDITELKLTEQALKDSEEKLEQQVIDRTSELQRSNEALQQFAHVISHDLKEPVRKFRLYTESLREELGTTISGNAEMHLEKISKAARRMQSMIDGVLSYSTFSALDPVAEAVDLNQVIQHVATDLELVISQKQAILQYDQLPVVPGFSILLYQLFCNLINNSLKFSRTGVPPIINITCARIVVNDNDRISVPRARNYWQVKVADNGIGFDEEHSEVIFQTFYRLHSKDRFEGTGLGLSLCKNIMERHNGTIKAEGKEGAGALFTMLFPYRIEKQY